MTLFASVVLWANIRMQPIENMPAFYCRGWPLSVISDNRPERWFGPGEANKPRYDMLHAAINIAVAASLLASIAGLSEFAISRKRKTA